MHPTPRNLDPPLQGGSDGDLSLHALYERYAGDIYRLAYRLTGSVADAEDVVQDVFLGLPEALRSYREEGKQDAWIRKVAARVALSRLRGRSRRREVSLDTAPPASTRGHSEVVTARITLQRALDRLPEALRTVLVLKDLEGYSHVEIGEMLGIRPGTSEVRLHRAHTKLRQILERTP